MSFECKLCNKQYSSYQSLWNHNKRFHTQSELTPTQQVLTTDSKRDIICEYCKKEFTRKNNMVRHQKTCKDKNKKQEINNKLENEIIELKKAVEKLSKTSGKKVIKNYNNGNIFNGVTNNSGMIINKLGTENLSELNDTEISSIFNKEIESVLTFVELLNFNERLPSNHSFCTTSLEGQYLSTYNDETKTIEIDRKRYFFDKLLLTSVERIELLYKISKHKFNKIKQKQIEDNITNLKVIRNSGFNNRIVKEMMKKLNMISYNKKDVVQKTWLNFANECDSEDDTYFADLVQEDLDNNKIAIKKNGDNIEYVEVYDNNITYLKPTTNIDSCETTETSSVRLPLIPQKKKVKEITV